ncbi:flagellar basal body-associated protein FliL [Ferrimonas balearica]|uniref:flagellar basal body-associated protein FliL n=1 Tax=Ferrimonas balearica TaxID=44012 RepID=UPI001C99FBF5|nr:flagellar basal body-associated protein FliL [Ferrimonas balearica]MBY5921296.1 flagellar basal body-associated protein FliL [Ferrimonas balearica]MBY5996019.1 flagellar basal body-associated protein FliL [Ferrimonas balearica]
MADDTLQVDVGTAPGKRRLQWMIAIGAGVLLLIAAVFGVVSMLGGSDEVSDPTQALSSNQIKPGLAQDGALYVPMPRPFLFNLPGPDRTHLVQIKVQLQVRGTDAQSAARKHIPLIEDTLLTTFSASDAAQIRRKEGKDELRTQALLNVQNALQSITGKPQVERVLFTGFVMQ